MKKSFLVLMVLLICSCSNTKNVMNNIKNNQEDKYNIEINVLNENYKIAISYKDSNPKLYIQYLTEAAQEGDPIAQDELAGEYAFGERLEKNPNLYLYWEEKSALQNYSLAQLNLGLSYLLGTNGLKKDNLNAKKWLNNAALNGEEAAQEYLKRFENGEFNSK